MVILKLVDEAKPSEEKKEKKTSKKATKEEK